MVGGCVADDAALVCLIMRAYLLTRNNVQEVKQQRASSALAAVTDETR